MEDRPLAIKMKNAGQQKWVVRMLVGLICSAFAILFVLSQPVQAKPNYQMKESYSEFEGVYLNQLTGVAIDSQSRIYVADSWNGRVVIFDAAGTELGKIDTPGDPVIDLKIKDDVLYVADERSVRRYDLNKDWEPIGGAINTAINVQINSTYGLAVDSEGNLFTSLYHYIVKTDLAGNSTIFLSFLDYGIYRGQRIVIDEEDNLYVLMNSHKILKWSKEKELLGSWDYGSRVSWGDSKAGLFYMDGVLYVGSSGFHSSGFFMVSATDGQVLGEYPQDRFNNSALNLSVDPLSGLLYVLYQSRFNEEINNFIYEVVVYEDIGTIVTANTDSDDIAYGDTVTIHVSVAANSGGGIPTGSVVLMDGDKKLADALLENGKADYTTAELPAGIHSLIAVYEGDTHYSGSRSFPVEIVVNHWPTATSAQTSAGNAAWGQPITVTANVSGLRGEGETPEGVVTFRKGTEVLGSGQLRDGEASLTLRDLPVGTHTIKVVYEGNDKFAGSEDEVAQLIVKADTTTTLTRSKETGVYGERVTFTATTTVREWPEMGSPTGYVTFHAGTDILEVVALDKGIAVLEVSDLSVGSHTIEAVYSGNNTLNSSRDQLVQTVDQAGVNMDMDRWHYVGPYGETVTFTVEVTPIAPGLAIPTGMMMVRNGTVTLASEPLIAGKAVLKINALPVGMHQLAIVYSGDGSFTGRDVRVNHTVNQAATTVNLSSSSSTSVYKESVTLTASVEVQSPGTGIPSGDVTFVNGLETLGVATLRDGIAELQVSHLPTGSYYLSAYYHGDTSYIGAMGSVKQVVNKAESGLSVTLSPDSVVYGEDAWLTATVSNAVYGERIPTGTVTLRLGDHLIGEGPLEEGGLLLSVAGLAVGSHVLEVEYSGDSFFNAMNQNAVLTVKKSDTATEAELSASNLIIGESASLTTIVRRAGPGSGKPSGQVTAQLGSQIMGHGTLIDGKSVIDIRDLPVGQHMLQVTYAGDGSFNQSAASPLNITVDKMETILSVQPSDSVIDINRPISFTVDIWSHSANSESPSGIVTLYNQYEKMAEAQIKTADKGRAQITIPQGWHDGIYEIYGEYEGNPIFHQSRSTAFELIIKDSSPPVNPPVQPPPVTPPVNPPVQPPPVTPPVNPPVQPPPITPPVSPPVQPPPVTPPVNPPVQPPPITPPVSLVVVNTKGKVVIPPLGRGVVSMGDIIRVDIPEGMSDQEILMTIDEVTDFSPLHVSDNKLISGIYEVRSNLRGQFAQEINISIAFDPSKLGLNQKAIIFYYDEDEGNWVEVGGRATDDSVVVSIDHLTKFAVFAVDVQTKEGPSADFPQFTDTQGHWGESIIANAAARRMANGYPDGTFRPNHRITRAEFAVMLTECLSLNPAHSPDVHTAFTDESQIGVWAQSAVYGALRLGIIAGYDDGSFRPGEPLSRAEMVAMVARALGLNQHYENTAFADDGLIPRWAKGAAEAVRREGIFVGRGDNKMSSLEYATRAEAVVILMRATGL